ncbi:MAG TPA: hypothetical protein VFO55_10680 [Gemmatimonadaceae bacterium]|nr:hypothetical protein [Gemmatimonadaceae bacterium]
MEFQRDIAPPPAEKVVEVEQERPRQTRVGAMSFSEALAKVEAHRGRVQATLAFAMLARLIADFDVLALIRSPDLLVQQLPFVGLALLSYMIVLWFLAARTRDRWGFGMALGIGVLQATYMIVLVVVGRLWEDPMLAWRPGIAAVTHLALGFAAFRAGGTYPPSDSKKPWVFGFLTAFIFVVIPWVAEPLMEAMGWEL